MKVQIFEKS